MKLVNVAVFQIAVGASVFTQEGVVNGITEPSSTGGVEAREKALQSTAQQVVVHRPRKHPVKLVLLHSIDLSVRVA